MGQQRQRACRREGNLSLGSRRTAGWEGVNKREGGRGGWKVGYRGRHRLLLLPSLSFAKSRHFLHSFIH